MSIINDLIHSRFFAFLSSICGGIYGARASLAASSKTENAQIQAAEMQKQINYMNSQVWQAIEKHNMT